MTHATAARLLALSLWTAVDFGLLVVALGVWFMVQDATVQGEDWDGLGLFIGALLIVGGLLWASVHLVAVLWLMRARRRGRSLVPVGTASAAVGGGLLLLQLSYVAGGGAELTTMVVPVCVSALVLVAGVVVASEARWSR